MNELKMGKCIKDTSGEVLFQNELCIKTCGDMNGAICSKGCMDSYSPIRGMTLIKNMKVDNNEVDVVLINDGITLTTLLHYNEINEEVRVKETAKLLSFGLSKSELTIFLKVLDGKKNSQIKTELFISKSTLKTHLNNIYKKLPEIYQQYKKRH
jgi:hypothetical protein